MAFKTLAVVAAVGSAFVAARAQTRTPGVEAYARVQALNAQLLASRSATMTLETWCRDHHLADDPRIVARAIAGAPKPVTAEQRGRLDVGANDEVRYRHVELRCGSRVFSDADNWYVPARLTAEMNRLLDATDTPFGKAVAPLEPTRETFAVKMWWTDSSLPMPGALFEHRAVLYTKDHRPFSEVDEVYQRNLW
jgi:hypothetical protein